VLQQGTSSAELIVRIYLAKSAPHNQMEAAAAMSASCGLSAKVSPPALDRAATACAVRFAHHATVSV
jgi:hypothetical protein